MGQGGNTAESISTALKSISDPHAGTVQLQSLNDVMDSFSFSETSWEHYSTPRWSATSPRRFLPLGRTD